MSDFFDSILIARRKYLASIVLEKERALTGAPEGTLRVSGTSAHRQYYHMATDGNNEVYLGREGVLLVRALAQKDYDQRIVKAGEEEMKILDRLIRQQGRSVEDVYALLSPARQTLVMPVRLTDEEYVRRWLENKKCEPMGFAENDPVILTSEGYRVRSKSEQLWADLMESAGVPHVFEPLIYLEGHGWIRPDFAGLNVRKRKEIIIEHMGMMDDPAYAERNVDKLHDYERNGFVLGDDLLITMETRKYPPGRKAIEEMIKRHFL